MFDRELFLKYREQDVRALALKGIDALTLQQIAGWQTACTKLPLWADNPEIRYPVRLSMEQCSSQETALYKANLVSRLVGESIKSFTDLTGGFGVDFTMIASLNHCKAVMVERNAKLCDIVRHNCKVLSPDVSQNAKILNDDAESVLNTMESVDIIMIDPARRDTVGRKVFLIKDCTPDVVALREKLLSKSRFVLIKLSPMLDIHDALRSLPEVREVHVVGVCGECKELLLVMAAGEVSFTPRIVCSDIRNDGGGSIFSFTYSQEHDSQPDFETGSFDFLYEPNAMLLKAGAYKVLCERYGVRKMAPDSHLYTSHKSLVDFPGRAFSVLNVCSVRQAKSMLADIRQANVSVRNFPMRADELRRKLKIKDGGDNYIFGTTTARGEHVLILCEKNLVNS